MRIFLSAGEASGDAYGATLAREIRKLDPEVCLEGVGGPLMRSAGVRILVDSSGWGAISISHALAVVPRAMAGLARARSALTPAGDVFVPIDFGAFNVPLARCAKAAGWRVVMFIPPGSWRRDRQGKDVPAIADVVVTPFPWSAELLAGIGVRAHFLGHPIKQLGQPPPAGPREAVAILPGSRRHEVTSNLPIIAEAVHGLDRPAVFAVAPGLDVDWLAAEWRRLAPRRTDDRFSAEGSGHVLAQCRAAVVCSGTATLEAALVRCPMVVVYRLSRATSIEAKLLRIRRPKFVALPNIILDRAVVPELVHEEARPEAIRLHLEGLLANGEARSAQISAFEELEDVLGPADAITAAARLILQEARS